MSDKKMTPIEARKSRGISPGFICKKLKLGRNAYWRRETLRTAWKPEEIEGFLNETNYSFRDVDFSLHRKCQ